MELLLMPLTAMGFIFILAPFFGMVPVAIFSGLYKWSRRKSSLVAATLWGIYTVYEYGMKLRILCSGECNIRVDLLLLYPLLIFVSLFALIRFILWKRVTKNNHAD